MATNPSSKRPATTLRCGNIKATVWQNVSEKGPFFSTTFSRPLLRRSAESQLGDLMASLGERLTLRGLMLRLTGRDVLKDFRTYLIRHLASHLDQGVAAWRNPARDRGFYAAWRASAHADPHFALSGQTAWAQTLERLPERSAEAISQALVSLGIEAPRWEG